MSAPESSETPERQSTGLWGGRFGGAADQRFLAFQESLSVDSRLLADDIEGSVAWAGALATAGVLQHDEADSLQSALLDVLDESLSEPERLMNSDAEDIHTFVEQRLIDKVGDLGKKLHTGRSRNDQVATDLRLHLRDQIDDLDSTLARLQLSLTLLAERTVDLPLPGFTHLQRAQPITAGHHALAYVEMFDRDRSRFDDTFRRMDRCPLGSAALAGTAFDIDRESLAETLGFSGGPTQNSLDATSDRDHVIELAFNCSIAMVHLSRLCEDWIFFASSEARFLELSDDVCTGSSLMPQKKNPDALELIRGRVGGVVGDLQALLMTMKGLPLAYDRDLQEDKGSLFHALDQTRACLDVMELVVRGAQYDRDRCAQAASSGYQNATDLADLMVQAGVPFRTAHERAGELVRRALELGVELEGLPAEERKRLCPELTGDWTELLSVSAVLQRRSVTGGTAPDRVREQVDRWRSALAEDAAFEADDESDS